MTLHEFNTLEQNKIKEALFNCCGSSSWVEQMANKIPYVNLSQLLETGESTWHKCTKQDWLEAFGHHPKIGDVSSLREKFAGTKEWTAGEQSGVQSASDEVLQRLSNGNVLYEEKFGFIFIVCATGKSAGEMLALLEERLPNAEDQEIKIAMQEQGKITRIRLQKLIQT